MASAATVYRHLLHAASAMKAGSQKSMTLQQIKGEFARGRRLKGAKRVAAALSRAEEELGFLHSQLSRTAQVQLLARRSDAVLAPPSTTYVVEGGSTVPRTAQAGAAPEEPSWSAAGGKGGHFVVRDGEVVEGSGAARGTSAASSFGVSESIDPDALARHKASMRRFKFMDRDGPAPRAPQWS